MPKLRFHAYASCDTCRKAKRWLLSRGYELEEIDITQNPPSLPELKKIWRASGKPLTAFFNRSGERYRALNMKERAPKMGEEEILELLSQEGRLLKRPLVSGGGRASVGFSEAEFEELWAL